MANYYISDLHVGHEKALVFDKRPFANIEEERIGLTERWNSVVNNDDVVWVLGDVGFKKSYTADFIRGLNGTKNLIVGNHDMKFIEDPEFRRLFKEVTPYKVVDEEILGSGRKLVLSHYPILTYQCHYHGWVHLYGHVHMSAEYEFVRNCIEKFDGLQGFPCIMYNVGCMLPYIDYTPRTLEHILLNGFM